jgi:putative FmdB family regulatory protein
MPTYEYTCPACGEECERFLPLRDRENQECASCGSRLTQQVRTPPQPNWPALARGESASPEAIARFDRNHKKKAEQENKAIAEHGSIN